MRFALSDDRIQFRDAVRTLLERECTADHVRRSWAGTPGPDGVEHSTAAPMGRVPAAWTALADMGVLGLTVPGSEGGLGMGDEDLVPLLMECGRAALPDPVAHTAGVAPPLLEASDDPVAGRWLRRIATGEAAVVVGFGDSALVAGATAADAILLCGSGSVRLLEPADADLRPECSVDGSRALARVDAAPDAGTLVMGGDSVPGIVVEALDRAATLSAAELVGLSRRMLDMTVEYVSQRHQFGVPIGSFQAVKHRLADAAAAVEFAEPLVLRAAHALVEGSETSQWSSMAKARASSAATAMAEAALQCHGAIGYTVEYDLHLFMKRAWALSCQHGDARFHRRRVKGLLLAR